MKCACNLDVLYGLVREGKVRRFTFSRELACFIQGKNPDHEIWKIDMVIGPEATPESTNCAFGIVDRRKGKLLRAAVTYEEAAFLCGDGSRYVAECRARRMEKYQDEHPNPDQTRLLHAGKRAA